jgi:hypothetical protein
MPKNLTVEQAVIINGFTGIECGVFGQFHRDLEKRLDRAVFTHELGDEALWKKTIKPLYRSDFIAMCPAEATEE